MIAHGMHSLLASLVGNCYPLCIESGVLRQEVQPDPRNPMLSWLVSNICTCIAVVVHLSRTMTMLAPRQSDVAIDRHYNSV